MGSKNTDKAADAGDVPLARGRYPKASDMRAWSEENLDKLVETFLESVFKRADQVIAAGEKVVSHKAGHLSRAALKRVTKVLSDLNYEVVVDKGCIYVSW